MRGKEEEMVEIMKSKSLAVVGLSETRMKCSGEKVLHETTNSYIVERRMGDTV